MNNPVNRKVLYLAIAALLASVLVGVNGILYANSVARASDRHSDQINAKTNLEVHAFCELLITLDDANKENPSKNPTQQKVADEIHSLRKSLSC